MVEMYLHAFSVCAVVLKDEVHYPGAVGLDVAVFVRQRWMYMAPRLLRLVGVVVDSLFHYGVERSLQWGSSPAYHGLDRFGECCDGWQQGGFRHLGHHACAR